MKKKLIGFSGLVLGLAPLAALAQVTGGTPTTCTGGQISTIQGLLCKVAEILNAVLPVLIALGVVYFVWGVITYMIASDEEAKTKGRDRIIFGIIGLAVIIAVWGLVAILRNTFGLQNTQNITFPTVPY
jgi:hypothetical protein